MTLTPPEPAAPVSTAPAGMCRWETGDRDEPDAGITNFIGHEHRDLFPEELVDPVDRQLALLAAAGVDRVLEAVERDLAVRLLRRLAEKLLYRFRLAKEYSASLVRR